MPLDAHGYLSRATVESINNAEALQGRAIAYINRSFAAESDDELTLESLTWERLVKELESAEQSGDYSELNEKLIQNILTPVIEQALTPPQQGQQ